MGILNIKVSGLRVTRESILACCNDDKLVYPMTYSGTATADLIEDYFSTHLLPNIPKNSIVVLDNARIHNKENLQELCDQYEIELYFLPSYCPELNKIEQIWALIKRQLRNHYDVSLTFLQNLDLAIRKYTKLWI